jgi:RHH-type proline utilization regulon transcriptional repressor/proline dehydrogenase/delta 1-pyrroline-5-carboxylate dehydrogenase
MAPTSPPFDSLDTIKYRDEREAVRDLLATPPLNGEIRTRVLDEAVELVRGARRSNDRQGVVESFLQEFSLGTREGLALMCLAEALLRTPDEDTRDRLIAEKIGSADWASHLGQSDSLFVNASTWGLMLTGKLVEVDEEARSDLPASSSASPAAWASRSSARPWPPPSASWASSSCWAAPSRRP